MFTGSFFSNDTGFSMQFVFYAICLLAAILETQSPLVLLGSGWVTKLNFNKDEVIKLNFNKMRLSEEG